MDQVYAIYIDVIARTSFKYGVRFELFVLMNNHFHALISTPRGNLSQAMRYFMTESSRAIARASKRINKIYGGRYKWTIIKDPVHYAVAYKYVARNPLEAKMVENLVDYRWSNLSLKESKLSALIKKNQNGFDEYLPETREHLMAWVHEEVEPDINESIRKMLRKFEFEDLMGKNRKYIDMYSLLPQ